MSKQWSINNQSISSHEGIICQSVSNQKLITKPYASNHEAILCVSDWSIVCHRLANGLPQVCQWFATGLPMVCSMFPHRLPQISQWFARGLPMICSRVANGFVNGLVYQWIVHVSPMVCVWLIEWRVKDWRAVCRLHVNGSTGGMHANMNACLGNASW